MKKGMSENGYQRPGNSKTEKNEGVMAPVSRRRHRGTPAITAAMVLLCLTLVSCHLTSGLYARYKSQDSGGTQARVARFSVSEAQMDFTDQLQTSISPGVPNNYQLQIDSEAAVRCEISVENTTLNLSDTNGELLTYTMTGGTGLTQVTGENSWYVYIAPETDTGVLTLSISLEDEIDPVYMGQIDNIVLTIHCEQID